MARLEAVTQPLTRDSELPGQSRLRPPHAQKRLRLLHQFVPQRRGDARPQGGTDPPSLGDATLARRLPQRFLGQFEKRERNIPDQMRRIGADDGSRHVCSLIDYKHAAPSAYSDRRRGGGIALDGASSLGRAGDRPSPRARASDRHTQAARGARASVRNPRGRTKKRGPLTHRLPIDLPQRPPLGGLSARRAWRSFASCLPLAACSAFR